MLNKKDIENIIEEQGSRNIIKILKSSHEETWFSIEDKTRPDQEALYRFLYPEKIMVCPNNNLPQFRAFSIGYQYCGKAGKCECAREAMVRNSKITNNNKTASEKQKSRDKQAKTNIERYGTAQVFASSKIQKKIKKTNVAKYGCENPNQNKEVQEKSKKTNIERYGVENPAQSLTIQAKIKETNIERYGFESPLQNSDVKEKIKETNIERYGCENPNQNREVRKKLEATNLEKYGCTNAAKSTQVREKISKNIKIVKFNNLDRYKDLVLPTFTLNEYLTIDMLTWVCSTCGSSLTSSRNMNGIPPRCYDCRPLFQSKGEAEVLDYIKTIYHGEVASRTKSIIAPKELDIYIPDLNFALEFNGTYWHSEHQNKTSGYHIWKTNSCRENDIQLLSLFSDDWENKTNQIKNMIKSRIINLDLSEELTNIRIIDQCVAEDFMLINHVNGYLLAESHIGLFYNNELIGVMTYSKDVSGGYTILQNAALVSENSNTKMMLTYLLSITSSADISVVIDRSFDIDSSFLDCGFRLVENILPKYKYIDIKTSRINGRVSFDNINVDIDEDLPEYESMIIEGYDRVWDCGYEKLIYKTNWDE